MTESITPRLRPAPELRLQPSMLSLRSTAATVAPQRSAHSAAQAAPVQGAWRQMWALAAISAAAAVLGVSALHQPARVTSQVHGGSPGYKQTSNGQDLHWQDKAITVYLDDSLSRLGNGSGEAVMQAFGQWVANDAGLPDLSFDTRKGSALPKQDGKSTVSYGPITQHGHEHDVAITVTYADDKTGEIVEADIILNTLYPMGVLTAKAPTPASTVTPTATNKPLTVDQHGSEEAVDCKNRYDVQNVTTHEAGHFFGLGEDPVERKATMFQTIDQCETHKRVLSATDVNAIGALYAASADPEEAKAGVRACSFGPAPQGRAALGLSAAFVGISLLRRRRAR